MLLALDPGVNSPGVALFSAELVMADRVPVPSAFVALSDGQRWWQVAERVVNHVRPAISGSSTLLIAFECPQWYQRGKSKGNPNQLVGIAGVAANVTGILSRSHAIRVLSPTPAEWIGQLPKTCPTCKANKKKCPECLGSAWNTPRGRRIASRLSEQEFRSIPDQNDAIDAVGLGLWALGRLTPRSVLSNGRDGR